MIVGFPRSVAQQSAEEVTTATGWIRSGRIWAYLERPRQPHLVALFRLAFFGGLLVHFGPGLLYLDENFGPDAVRFPFLQEWVFQLHSTIPNWLLRVMAAGTMVSCGLAAAGFRVRFFATFTLFGTWFFTNLNALPFLTLAIASAWAILPAFCLCDGAATVMSVDSWWRKRRNRPRKPPPSVLGTLVLFQLLLAFSFAGIEKVLAGWPFNHEMTLLLQSPKGWILRDWAADSSFLKSPETGRFFAWHTVLSELLLPAGLLFRPTRWYALLLFELLFVGIVITLQVPPLFFAVFAIGMLLIIDEKDIERIRSVLGLRTNPPNGSLQPEPPSISPRPKAARTAGGA